MRTRLTATRPTPARIANKKFFMCKSPACNSGNLFGVFIAKDGIDLNPSHVGFRNIRLVTGGAYGCRVFRSCLRVWQRMMPESKKAPPIGFGEPFTVFNGCIDAVELAVEKPMSRRFCTRAIWKRRIKNSSEFLYNQRAFRE